MKDFFGQLLQLNDIVAFNQPYYKGLTRGKIIKFTPKGVRVEYVHQNFTRDTAVFGRDVVKMPN